jgi:putative transposase
MLLAKKIKLEVTDEDAAALEFMQGKCRGLYNWWVMRLRAGERWHFAEAKRSLQQSRKHEWGLTAHASLQTDVSLPELWTGDGSR